MNEIKKHLFTSSTVFDIVDVSDCNKLVQKKKGLDDLIFPKVKRSELSTIKLDFVGSVKLTQEEIDADERLKYILSR